MNQRKDIFIFIGPPGSGKGSLSRLCINKLNWKQLSTGNLCRQQVAMQTETGKVIDEALKAGKLVSDQIIINMVDEWILKNIDQAPALILDGYPRTLVQAQALKKMIEKNLPVHGIQVIRLSLSDDEILARLLHRATCFNQGCQMVYSLRSGSDLLPKRNLSCDACGSKLAKRDDDDSNAIVERIKTYYKHEKKLIDFYRQAGIDVEEFQVERPLPDIFHEFSTIVDVDTV